ncbi:MAG: hypothetical protein ACI4SG_08530 [Oligosphaeraceae bacterium]
MRTSPLLLVLLLLGISLQADDSRWVKAAYQWRAGGTVCTQVIPLYGADFRIHYSQRHKGALKITLVDASESAKPQPTRVVVDTKNLVSPGRRDYSGYQKAYLIVEGDSRGWDLSVDLYLDSLTEWKWKSAQEEFAQAKMVKQGFWVGEGSQQISFSPKSRPWKLVGRGEKPLPMKITVRTQDQQLLFQRITQTVQGESSGWFHSAAPVTITVEAPQELPWTLETLALP